MSRNIVSIFLSIIFLVFIAGPTILVMIDDSVDVSSYYTSTSSEEENNNHVNKEVKVLAFVQKENEFFIALTKKENNSCYSLNNYPKIHLNLISPPPDLYII